MTFSLFATPTWFNGVDLLFDTISLIVAFLIAGYSWKIYRLSKENKFGYFSFAFILIGLAFFTKIVTQGLVYFENWRNTAMAVLITVVGRATYGVNYSELFFRGGFFLFMITLLGAWLLLFFVSQKRSGRLHRYYDVSQIALFIYLLLLVTTVANLRYVVFYLTSSVILGMTVLNYYKNYLDTDKHSRSFLVMAAFSALTLGNIFSVFLFLNQLWYVVGEVFLLIGFLLLLYTYRSITKD